MIYKHDTSKPNGPLALSEGMRLHLEIARLSAYEMAEKIRKRELSVQEVVRAHVNLSNTVNADLNAFIHIGAEYAEKRAREIDAKLARGEVLSPLAGVPVAIKDNIATNFMPTTAASAILKGWTPPYNAHVSELMLDADMVVFGKTNLDEFAVGGSGVYSAYGPTSNPWSLHHSAGGSGSGSAAAVAAFCTPLALGSDTGGSVRQPASFTATVGAKPTYGAVSRFGLLAMASSLDHIGQCARNVLDAAILADVLYGHCAKDATSLDKEWESMQDAALAGKRAENAFSGLKIGVVRQYEADMVHPGVWDNFLLILQYMQDAGAQIIEVDAPSFLLSVATYYMLMSCELFSNLARYDGVRYGPRMGEELSAIHSMQKTRSLFGPEVKRRVLLGAHALASDNYTQCYAAAQRVRMLARQDYANAFEQVDVIVSPTAPVSAFSLDAAFSPAPPNPEEAYRADMLTIPANLAGVPAISIPSGFSEGLPLGVQIVAPFGLDREMFFVASMLENLIIDRLKINFDLFATAGKLTTTTAPKGASASDFPTGDKHTTASKDGDTPSK